MTNAVQQSLKAGVGTLILVGLYLGLTMSWGGLPPVERFVDPGDGLWYTARTAELPSSEKRLALDALEAPVTVVRDERGVPHIYAESDRDAVIAMGYTVAQDRLFQMEFISRVAQGGLSGLVGADMAEADRFLRSTGMEWGAQQNIDRMEEEADIEYDAMQWYADGANAYIDGLHERDYPLEYRVLDTAPTPRAPIDGPRLVQFMTYDLTYNSDSPLYATLQERLDPDDYATLYPDHPPGLYASMYPEGSAEASHRDAIEGATANKAAPASPSEGALHLLQAHHDVHQSLQHTLLEGYRFGKGSNNWAIAPERSDTGGALLANDMHLGLNLPAIWYEVHLHTPTTHISGLTIPGAPIIVQGMNDHVGWALTNTGADVVDHYALELNDDRTQYRYNDEWHDLDMQVDTLYMQGSTPITDTLRISRWGPLLHAPSDALELASNEAVALQWVAHHPNTTLKALWAINRATSTAEIDEALTDWSAPMQNIAMADTDGNIGMRTAGRLPVRASGTGRGLLPGDTDMHEWTGWVPHDEMPHVHNPERGVLGSANQVPVEASYPHYMGHDWRDGHRSVRLDTLLDGQEMHTLNDMKAYQQDVVAIDQALFAPHIQAVDSESLSEAAQTVQSTLLEWDGAATTETPAALPMQIFLRTLRAHVWDDPAFDGMPTPQDAVLLQLLEEEPAAPWFSRADTDELETGPEMIQAALEDTADTLAEEYGDSPDDWAWGQHHQLVVDHLLGEGPFAALGRGPHAIPSFGTALFQAPGLRVTGTASQRAVMDFSGERPEAHVVYPGGQSGHPLHPTHYDLFMEPFLAGAYYVQARPQAPDEIEAARVTNRMTLQP